MRQRVTPYYFLKASHRPNLISETVNMDLFSLQTDKDRPAQQLTVVVITMNHRALCFAYSLFNKPIMGSSGEK